jgi:hypothetical protein
MDSTTVVPMEGVRETDVLFGPINNTGRVGQTHKGNRLFCTIIEVHQWQYCVATTSRKHAIATSIHKYYTSQNHRFLQKQKGKGNYTWNVITSPVAAIKKIKQALYNGSIQRRQELQVKLSHTIHSRAPATIYIDVPLNVLPQIIASRFVIDPNKVYKKSISNKTDDDDDNSIKFYATIDFPECRHNTKAILKKIDHVQKKQRRDTLAATSIVNNEMVSDDAYCETNSHQMSTGISTGTSSIIQYTEVATDGTNSVVSHNTASILLAMSCFMENSGEHIVPSLDSAFLFESLISDDSTLPEEMTLELEATDTDDNVLVETLLQNMAEEYQDEEYLLRSESEQGNDSYSVGYDSHPSQSIGSYTVTTVSLLLNCLTLK